jgi:hypothetical protein
LPELQAAAETFVVLLKKQAVSTAHRHPRVRMTDRLCLIPSS